MNSIVMNVIGMNHLSVQNDLIRLSNFSCTKSQKSNIFLSLSFILPLNIWLIFYKLLKSIRKRVNHDFDKQIVNPVTERCNSYFWKSFYACVLSDSSSSDVAPPPPSDISADRKFEAQFVFESCLENLFSQFSESYLITKFIYNVPRYWVGLLTWTFIGLGLPIWNFSITLF